MLQQLKVDLPTFHLSQVLRNTPDEKVAHLSSRRVSWDVVADSRGVSSNMVANRGVSRCPGGDMVADRGVSRDVVADRRVSRDVVADRGVTRDVVADRRVSRDVVANRGVSKSILRVLRALHQEASLPQVVLLHLSGEHLHAGV